MKFVATAFLILSMSIGADARLDGIAAIGKRPHHEHEVAESRIVGGSAASVGEYLYFVSWNGCAASLIADDIILSAAHCAGIGSNSIIVGAHQKWWGQTSGDAESRTISERRVHPDYSTSTFANDFIVMKLTEPVTHIIPVMLNGDAVTPNDGETLTAIGFGSLREGGLGFSPRYLQEVDLQKVSQEQCNAEYDGDIVEDVMLCAGIDGGGKDSCQGDSGGPIVLKTDEGHVQVGVVSWGYGCARKEYSGVYSRVSGAKEWIEQQVCELSSSKLSYCSGNTIDLEEDPEIDDPEENDPDTDGPPGKVDCIDSESETFLIDDNWVDRGCSFLKDEVDQYGYLCKFVDVAFACPDLCEICDRLEPYINQ